MMYQYYNTNSSRVVTQRSNLTSFIVQSLSASRGTSGWAQMEAALRDFPKAAVDSTRISPRAFLAKRSVLPARVVAKTAARNDFSSDDGAEDTTHAKKKIVVVGAGWGGWGAAKAVAESETASVVLLDGVPDPTGRTGTRATSGKPFEAGVRGFWKDYPNINHLVVSDGFCLGVLLRVRKRSDDFRTNRRSFIEESTTPLFSLHLSVSLFLRLFLTPFLLFFRAGLIDANTGIERRGRIYGVHAIEFL